MSRDVVNFLSLIKSNDFTVHPQSMWGKKSGFYSSLLLSVCLG
jgi:hypothetical protein